MLSAPLWRVCREPRNRLSPYGPFVVRIWAVLADDFPVSKLPRWLKAPWNVKCLVFLSWKCWFVIRSMKQTNLFQNENGIAFPHNCLKCSLLLLPNNLAVTFPSIAAGNFYQKMMKSPSLKSTSFTGGPGFLFVLCCCFFWTTAEKTSSGFKHLNCKGLIRRLETQRPW